MKLVRNDDPVDLMAAYLVICGALGGFLFEGFAGVACGVAIGAVAPHALCQGLALIGAVVGAEPLQR